MTLKEKITQVIVDLNKESIKYPRMKTNDVTFMLAKLINDYYESDNNGWIKIESEKDLPINIESRKVLFRTKEGITTTYFSEDIFCEIPNHFLRYSHWRIKDEILDPIY
jgi:hypothetical protein